MDDQTFRKIRERMNKIPVLKGKGAEEFLKKANDVKPPTPEQQEKIKECIEMMRKVESE